MINPTSSTEPLLAPSVNEEYRMEGSMNEIETFYGLIETTADALKVIELCRQGKLGRVRRRLHEKERKMIRSGSVFVFDETESGVKRWTDGRLWSPSRILGNFLIYRELERKTPGSLSESRSSEDFNFNHEENGVDDRTNRSSSVEEAFNLENYKGSEDLEGLIPWLSDPIINASQDFRDFSTLTEEDNLETLKSKKLLNNHKGRYVFKPGGLIKKTISVKIDDHPHHLVCYYNQRDFCQGHLGSGSFNTRLMQEMRKVVIPPELLCQQSFRKPAGLSIDSEFCSKAFADELTTNSDRCFPGTPFNQHRLPPITPSKKIPNRRRNSFPGGCQQPSSRMPNITPYGYVPIAPAIGPFPSTIPEVLLFHGTPEVYDQILPTLESFPFDESLFGDSRKRPSEFLEIADSEATEELQPENIRKKIRDDEYSSTALDEACLKQLEDHSWVDWPESELFSEHPGEIPGVSELLLQEQNDPMLPCIKPPTPVFDTNFRLS